MKIVILNTTELTGGAAVAANRLAKALQKAGANVSMLVRDRRTNDPMVVSVNSSYLTKKINFLRFLWERLIIFICNSFNRKMLFQVSIANTGTDVSCHPLIKEADIIHLHWINHAFLSLTDIRKLTRLGKPIVWTMHDMWPITGICHHSFGCELFMKECGNCHFLQSNRHKDLSYFAFREKLFISETDISLVAVSSWLKQLALRSALTSNCSVSVIPNPIDTSFFSPADKLVARVSLSLPSDKKIILMGAARINDPVKGIHYLLKALSAIKEMGVYAGNEILLVFFGGIKGDDSFLSEIPVPFVSMGLLQDTSRIAQLYAAADVTVVSSLYETFGQTLIESMSCGCPVVSFNNSGQTDIIDHLINGYLAEYENVNDLAAGIQWVLKHPDKRKLSEACIKKVRENYIEDVVAKQYIDLYNSLLKKSSTQ